MRSLILIAALSASAVFAHGKPTTHPTTPAPIAVNVEVEAGAKAVSESNASALSHSSSTSNSSATGGNASASSGGNTLSTSTTYNQVRQAPPVSLGGLFIGECGAGAQGGGSGSHGAGALGFSWTPKDCKHLLAARAFAALGMFKEACEQVMQVSVVRATYPDNTKQPSCEFEQRVANDPAAPAALDVSNFATKDDVAKLATKEEVRRAFTGAVGK